MGNGMDTNMSGRLLNLFKCKMEVIDNTVNKFELLSTNRVYEAKIMLAHDVYLASCYYLEYMAYKNNVFLGSRNIGTYISIVKERSYLGIHEIDLLCDFEEFLIRTENNVKTNDSTYEYYDKELLIDIVDTLDICLRELTGGDC